HETMLSGDLPDDPAAVAQLVADVWTYRNEKMAGDLRPEEWLDLFDQCAVPVLDESAVVPGLPLVAYRAGHPDGMSWTTDRTVAERFAPRNGEVYRCIVSDLGDLLAVLHDRNEHEVVLHPHGAWRESVELAETVSPSCHESVDAETI